MIRRRVIYIQPKSKTIVRGIRLKAQNIVALIQKVISKDKIKINEPMKNHTTFKVGGPADILIAPANKDEIMGIVNVCRENDIPMLVVGNGSNLIVRDNGIRGVVLKMYDSFSDIKVEGDLLRAQAGVLLSKVANTALNHSLAGMEFAAGIPGTLGGAVFMNAGAYGGEMKDIVVESMYIDENGVEMTVKDEEHQFGYRKSFAKDRNYIILESLLKLKEGNHEEIKAAMSELSKKRREKQPLQYPSAGSTFKRPEGFFAGKLIEDCGLKGYSIGGAQVSELHAGFIISKGNATSKDIIDLIEYIQQKVKDRFGVLLEPEVKIVGEG